MWMGFGLESYAFFHEALKRAARNFDFREVSLSFERLTNIMIETAETAPGIEPKIVGKSLKRTNLFEKDLKRQFHLRCREWRAALTRPASQDSIGFAWNLFIKSSTNLHKAEESDRQIALRRAIKQIQSEKGKKKTCLGKCVVLLNPTSTAGCAER